MSLIPLPQSLIPFLDAYLPRDLGKTFVTLTYAQSLDSKIAAKPGVQTKISHPETKTMTHYLRSKHDGIMVGIGTVLADDPKLNCRYQGSGTPIPVILDPNCVWDYAASNLRQICDMGQGKPPIILIDESKNPSSTNLQVLQDQHGKYVKLPLLNTRKNNWNIILDQLYSMGIKSIMIEGGAKIINELLNYEVDSIPIVDSVIITIGPVFLGNDGVSVSPLEPTKLKDVKWWVGVQDSVICATIEH